MTLDKFTNYKMADGVVYTGQVAIGTDTKHGYGTEKHPNGSSYVGWYADNLYHGKGKFTDDIGNSYEGQWSNGVKHGEGV